MGKRPRWSEMDRSAISLAQLRRAFEVYNQTSGKSPHTCRWDSEKLALFERFSGDGCALADITLETVREFIADLQGRRIRHEHNPFVRNKHDLHLLRPQSRPTLRRHRPAGRVMGAHGGARLRSLSPAAY